MKLANITSEHEQKNNQFFSKIAWFYDVFEIVLAPTRQKVVKFLKEERVNSVLDVACGTGSLSVTLARAGYTVTGVDLSPDMLVQAKKKLNPSLSLNLRQADATNLPFEDSLFDASTISLGLHDMPHEIELAVLKEMKRVTKKNGVIVVADYLEPYRHIMARLAYSVLGSFETENYKPFVKRSLAKLLYEASLTIEKESKVLGLFQVVVAK